MNLSDRSAPARRFLPEEPLPPYTHIPGRTPHPESAPAGHSHGKNRPRPAPLEPARWSESRTYLRGLDLFQAGYFWESHVEFESLWLAAGRHGATADFLRGLIHLAACGVKHLENNPAGVHSHASRAAKLFQSLDSQSAEPSAFGIPLPSLVALASSVAVHGWPREPVRLAIAAP
jgi:hypothetical protein